RSPPPDRPVRQVTQPFTPRHRHPEPPPAAARHARANEEGAPSPLVFPVSPMPHTPPNHPPTEQPGAGGGPPPALDPGAAAARPGLEARLGELLPALAEMARTAGEGTR